MRSLALLLAIAFGDPRLFESDEAQAAFDEGSAAYEAGDWERASEALGRAYAIEPKPQLLYARAQAERSAGRCPKAVPLYIEFLDTRPPAKQAELVQWNVSLCLATMSLDAGACDQAEAQLSAIRPDAEGDETRSKAVLELEMRLEGCRAPEVEPPPPIVEPVPETEPAPEPPPPVLEPQPTPQPRRPRVDPWGVALGAGSLVAAGAAVGLLLGSDAQLQAVSLEGTHGRALARGNSGRTLRGAGIGAAAAAGGLAVGAVVHWLVWRRRADG